MNLLRKVLTRLEPWLGKSMAPFVIVVLAALLVSPSLRSGWASDDFARRAAEQHASIALGHAPFDLFDFASGRADDATRLRAVGVFPWWADDAARIHFFRPLASATHGLDRALWPDNPVGEHAQNVFWYLLLVGVAWLVLRHTGGPRWLAAFALLLFAIDDTHGNAVGWIASRNTILCAIFGFLALWAHDRWRRGGWRAGALLGPLSFTVAMFCGEAGVATLGYLIAHALFLDEGRPVERAQRLVPYALVVAGFAAIYMAFGYGARATGQYIDPAGEPARYLVAVVTRLPIMLHALLSGPPADFWAGYPLVNPALPAIMWLFAVACVGVFAWVAWPVVAPDREARFWLVGAVLAALPACAGLPSNRPLLFAGLGAMVVVARFVVAVARRSPELYPGRVRRSFAAVNAGWLFFSALPLSLWTLEMTSHGNGDLQVKMSRAGATLPDNAALAGKTLVVVDAPLEPLVFYDTYERAAAGAPRTSPTRLLATSSGRALHVERVDARGLRLSSERGLLSRNADMTLRSPGRDLGAGAAVDVPGMQVQVERTTADGVPASVLFRFDVPLEDPSLHWVHWDTKANRFAAWAPPAPGAAPVDLPAADLAKVFAGG